MAESDDSTTIETKENEVTITVTLSADPERSVTVPLTSTNQDGASNTDYSGVPASVTFASGDTEKTFTFAATADEVDDDGESVKLAFGTLPDGVTAGSTAEAVVSITDDDVPAGTGHPGADSRDRRREWDEQRQHGYRHTGLGLQRSHHDHRFRTR